ncbi:TlyA family rRNA (cytidine-2'-O)-methyltransferase [Paenibacillus cisolokensis]|uniref:TlyA family rRNA (Cytidine-2'-O)-methyltransferase n=1 Tax=Paenibacillus cisolokensis TaxID=1658519 RepID=A0ABQ4NDS8_9BACL|nr:TlyA family RNA methyltransferase [Paenibacillus cisolokensis]GIQ66392.1 TlyA family rRNA (cytidine-2'-O)-methyltransferase [Paenibacillus cisolokensis]
MDKKRSSLWKVLVDRGLFEDRKTAASWILSGKVIVNGEKIQQEGTPIPVNSEIIIKGFDMKYVGKGGLKLERALEVFSIDVSGRVAIDAGASTGGFTDCLLQKGCSKVYSVDVGFGQLAGKLRSNPNVINMEKTNISEVKIEQLNPLPSIAVIDISYLSLKKAVPIVSKLITDDGDIICLVKLLFEVNDVEIRRSGVIEDEKVYKDILLDLVDCFTKIGFSIRGITNSPITGNNRTIEFLFI